MPKTGNASHSLKGYTYEIFLIIKYILTDNMIKELILETGNEDIDIIYDNNKICNQIKYYTSDKTDEHMGILGGFFTVYKRFVLNREKYDNVSEILYSVYWENNMKCTKCMFHTDKLKEELRNMYYETYISEIQKNSNLPRDIIEKNTDEFINLINIKHYENIKFEYNYFLKLIKNSTYFNNINLTFKCEFIMSKLLKHIFDTLYNQKDVRLDVANIVNTIKNDISTDISVNTILSDLLSVCNTQSDSNIVKYINIVTTQQNFILQASYETLFKIIYTIKPYCKSNNNALIELNHLVYVLNLKIINDRNEIDCDKKIKVLQHLKCIFKDTSHKCCERHIFNILAGNKYNEKIKHQSPHSLVAS